MDKIIINIYNKKKKKNVIGKLNKFLYFYIESLNNIIVFLYLV